MLSVVLSMKCWLGSTTSSRSRSWLLTLLNWFMSANRSTSFWPVKPGRLSDRNGHDLLGYPSPTALLIDQGRMSAGHAKRIVTQANAVDKAPDAYQSWTDGRISTDQAMVLFTLAETVPGQYPAAEQRLVDTVEGLNVQNTRKALEYWLQSVNGPGESDAHVQQERRSVSLSETWGGMFRIDGWLTPLHRNSINYRFERSHPTTSRRRHSDTTPTPSRRPKRPDHKLVRPC